MHIHAEGNLESIGNPFLGSFFEDDFICKMPLVLRTFVTYDTSFKGGDQRENMGGVWSNINTRYLVWRCGDGRSFAL